MRTLGGVAGVALGLALLTSCNLGDPDADAPQDSAPSQREPSSEPQPSTDPAEDGDGPSSRLQPGFDDEQVVWRRSDVGGRGRVRVGAGDVVSVYVLCSGESPVQLTLDTAAGSETMRAVCDEVLTRRQLYKDRDDPVTVRIVAPDTVTWEALVTKRWQ